jgi:hypothetical protein
MPGRPSYWRGEQLERVPAVTPCVAQFRFSLQHDKPQALAFEVPGDRQTGLAAADDDRIEKSIRWCVLRRLLVHGPSLLDRLPLARARQRRATLKLNIMPLCMCSAMWQ